MADLTKEGRSWSNVWSDCLAICSASTESITNLGQSILEEVDRLETMTRILDDFWMRRTEEKRREENEESKLVGIIYL